MTNTDLEDPSFLSVRHAEISIDEQLWLDHDNLENILNKVLTTVLSGDEEISLLLTNDTRIQILNRDFRSQDKPTNVLSFPSDEDNFLGDIAISFNTLKREAEEQDKDFNSHFIHILIHGILHLLGYDHIDDDEAEEMEALEIKILEDMGIKNPYI